MRGPAPAPEQQLPSKGLDRGGWVRYPIKWQSTANIEQHPARLAPLLLF
jgi:hypothetical protein